MNIINKFWVWYERHYNFHLKFAAFLFSWQIVHLVWLAIAVVLPMIFQYQTPNLPRWFNLLLAIVDYTEIPAIISTSLIYINELRKQFNKKSLWLLIFLNTQWLHLFWITDEFVVTTITNRALVVFPIWLAWIAILIDYLEVPVIFDTWKKYLKNYNKKTAGAGGVHQP
jgi:hypothetical protein